MVSGWSSYFEARRQTIEENDSPCRNRDEVTMELVWPFLLSCFVEVRACIWILDRRVVSMQKLDLSEPIVFC